MRVIFVRIVHIKNNLPPCASDTFTRHSRRVPAPARHLRRVYRTQKIDTLKVHEPTWNIPNRETHASETCTRRTCTMHVSDTRTRYMRETGTHHTGAPIALVRHTLPACAMDTISRHLRRVLQHQNIAPDTCQRLSRDTFALIERIRNNLPTHAPETFTRHMHRALAPDTYLRRVYRTQNSDTLIAHGPTYSPVRPTHQKRVPYEHARCMYQTHDTLIAHGPTYPPDTPTHQKRVPDEHARCMYQTHA